MLNKVLFAFVSLASAVSFAAPQTLNFAGESKFKKDNYVVSMNLNLKKENSKRASYEGTATLVQDGQEVTKQVSFQWRLAKGKIDAVVQLRGDAFDGEELDMSGEIAASDLKAGDKISLKTYHIEAYTFPVFWPRPPNPDWEGTRRTVLDSGVTELVVQ